MKIGFDLETTGPDPETARIVTATIITEHNGAREVFEWVVNPGVEIPAEVAAIHGYTTERAILEGVSPMAAIPEIVRKLADIQLFASTKASTDFPSSVIIYNAAYDLTVLDREIRRYYTGAHSNSQAGLLDLLSIAKKFVFDPMVIDRALDKYRKGSRKLIDTVKWYGGELKAEDAHSSTGDVTATMWLADMIHGLILATLGDRPYNIEYIQSYQQRWKAEQAASSQAYFRRKDPDAVVNGDWPMIPFKETVTV